MLDLTTLVAQPGFGSSATASEVPGFDGIDVTRLEVQWNGSGGLDDLSFCAANPPRASMSLRNGLDINPTLLSAASPPVIGASWSSELDCGAFGGGVAVLEVRRLPQAGALSAYGEVLIGGTLLHRAVGVTSGNPSHLTWTIPNDLSLGGLSVHVQGLCQGTPAVPLHSRLRRVERRLTNALDLVLGF